MRLVKNTLANLAGSLLGPLLAIVLTPFYIRNLGLEGYGLVGFFAMLQVVLGVVSVAMGKVYLREVAARAAQPVRRQGVPALFQLFLLFFAALGLFVALGIAALSWWISHRWVHLEHLDPGTVQACVLLLAVTFLATLPTGVCTDTLFALQEHVRLNSLLIAIYLLTTVAAVVLVATTHSVIGYYAASATGAIVTFALTVPLAARRLRSHLGEEVVWPRVAQSFRKRKSDAFGVVRDSLALLWTEGAGVIITQTDRLLITALLPLSSLGIYNLGSSIGRLVQMACTPLLTAAYPRLCERAAQPGGHAAAARDAFRLQGIVLVLASALAMPVCAIPEALLTCWIHDPALAARAGSVSAIFAVAYACLALAGAPYNLAVATGHTRFGAIFNVLAALWYPLLGWWLIRDFGLLGAAGLWLSYTASSLLACSLVGWLVVARGCFAFREVVRFLAVPALALGLGGLVRAAPRPAFSPLLVQISYAAAGSLAIVVAGAWLVLGRAEMARLAARWGARRPVVAAR